MALANATLITVTGTYTRLDGRPAKGQVFFSSNQVLVDSSSGEIVPPVDFVATLDANGAISIDLPATDDTDYEPTGWTYTVTEDTDGGDRPPYGLSVPADGGTIDLADVAPPGPTESLSSDEYTLLSTFTSHRSNADEHIGEGLLSTPAVGDVLRHEGTDGWQVYRGSSAGEALVWDGSAWVRDSDTYSQVRDAAVTVTVGGTGDYATITDALTALGRDYAAFVDDGFTAEVSLLSGFVMAEQVFIRRVNLGWVKITSEDATVTIDRSALTTGSGLATDKPAFYVEDGVGPIIDVSFSMDTSGTADDQTGVQLRSSYITILPGAGVDSATRRGLDMHDCASARARNTHWIGSGGHGVRVGNRSQATLRDATVKDSGSQNIAAGNGSIVTATDAILTGANGSGVYAVGALVEADGADGTGNAGDGFTVVDGGIISAHGATGTLSQTPNVSSDQGVIYAALEAPTPAVPSVPITPASATWQDADRSIGIRVEIPRRAVYRYFLFRVDVSSGNIEAGLLRMSGADLLTATTVMSSGSIACPAAGFIRLDLGATTVEPGPHLLYIAADNTTFETFNGIDNAIRATRSGLTLNLGPGSNMDQAWQHTTRYIGAVALEGDT